MKADKNAVLKRLKTAKGQIEGIIKMVEEDRYCIDISNQLLAVDSLISSCNKLVLKAHINHCVLNAAKSGNEKEIQEKSEEIEKIIEKLIKI